MTKVHVDFTPISILASRGLPNGARVFLANEIVKISDPYAPFRDGYLKNSARVLNNGSQIEYGGVGPSKAYARRMWFGDTFNFNEAPTRGSRWVERAVASNSKQLIASVQSYVNRGGK